MTSDVIDGEAQPCPTDNSSRATINTGHTVDTAVTARPATSIVSPIVKRRCVPNRSTSRPYAPPWIPTNTRPTPRKTAADEASVKPKRRLAEQRERCLECGERHDRDEADNGEVTQDRRGRSRQTMAANVITGMSCLGQPNDRCHRVDRRQHAGDVERNVWSAERGQSSDGRAQHEADAEGRTEQTDQARSLGLWCEIGHRRLGHRQTAARGSVDDSTGEQATTTLQPHP